MTEGLKFNIDKPSLRNGVCHVNFMNRNVTKNNSLLADCKYKQFELHILLDKEKVLFTFKYI